jgi:hypothetical protein
MFPFMLLARGEGVLIICFTGSEYMDAMLSHIVGKGQGLFLFGCFSAFLLI